MRDAAAEVAALAGVGLFPLRAISRSLAQTAQLAAALAPALPAGSALCLEGDLGAGKTTFVAALVAALGGAGPVVSPTFTLENRYPLRPAGGAMTAPRQVVHADLYRCDETVDEELVAMLLEARDAGALLCVEWGTRLLPRLRPCWRLAVAVMAGTTPEGDAARAFTLDREGEPWPAAVALAAAWSAAAGGAP